MGLFSSKRKTYVDTAVVRVTEDELIPDSLRTGILKAIFQGNPIAASIQTELLNGVYRNFEKMYRYAESGDYYYGLPNARVLSSDDNASAIKAAIEAEVGSPVVIEYAYFRPMNHVHAARKYLAENYGYDTETNEITLLSAEKEATVYLSDLVSTYHYDPDEPSDAGHQGVWGSSPRAGGTFQRLSRFLTVGLGRYVSTQDYREGPEEIDGVEIHVTWRGEGITAHTEHFFLDLSEYTNDLEYYQAQYRVGGKTYYWTYAPGDGLYPDLDGIYNPEYTDPGTYFPIAMFRHHRENRTADGLEDTEEFKSTEKLLSFIGIDFKEMGKSIHENPDIDDVEQAVLMMAVPADSQDQVEMDYLFRFFDRLNNNTPSSPRTLLSMSRLGHGEDPTFALEIADADFRIVLSYHSIGKRLVPGVIGPVGFCTNTLGTIEIGKTILGNIGIPYPVRYYRRQRTSHVYEEITVVNPQLRYDIFEDRSVVGGATDDLLLIPLDRDLVRQLSIVDREYLYFRSLHIVANSRVTVKTRWYQSGVFKAILTIAAIVITVVSLGGAWKTIAAAGSLWGSVAALTILALKLAAMEFAFNQVARWIGPELAFYLAVVAAVWGGAKALKAGGVGQDKWAKNLLDASTGLTKGNQNELGRLTAEYKAELEAFELMAEEKWAELEEAQNSLNAPSLLDPFDFVGLRPLTLFGESPEDYYSRTVHAGNPGVMSLDLVENYVDLSLKLPTVTESLMELYGEEETY